MWEYLRRHEAFVRRVLESEGSGFDWAGLLAFHETQTERMQKERLIHLMVTLAFGLYLMVGMAWTSIAPSLESAALCILMVGLLGAYIVHYFRLENGVQRWYHLANEIERRARRLSAKYD